MPEPFRSLVLNFIAALVLAAADFILRRPGLVAQAPACTTRNKRMPRLTNTAPNRVLQVDTQVVNEEPLLALLNLETDDGAVELAINRSVAELMVDQLMTLLGYDEDEE